MDEATFAALIGAMTSQPASAPQKLIHTSAIPADLVNDIPLSQEQMARVKKWSQNDFRNTVKAAIDGTGFPENYVYAIAGKESAIYWVGFIDRLNPNDILRLCVFDASGDFPGTSRDAFPRNADAMRHSAYADLVDPLIAAANEMRRVLHGWSAAQFLYKRYGIFQYDLQNIQENDGDRDFLPRRTGKILAPAWTDLCWR